MVMVDSTIKTMLIVITTLVLLMLLMKHASRTDKCSGHRVVKLLEDSRQWFRWTWGRDVDDAGSRSTTNTSALAKGAVERYRYAHKQ
ncbi:Hypothetical protein P9303_17231 [Prochlorococcus marinus str. MIT 9303]|uniref:Secreted protein n=1 Tax=Prochlorococcus marinus (strain MIT 9303) TaxID=59922 RepID=A2CAF7_PROM3|nr:Hypothetical protein P9303_17231 [Prochlorococcus marinus str. MIT 9303]